MYDNVQQLTNNITIYLQYYYGMQQGKGVVININAQYLKIILALLIHSATESCLSRFFLLYYEEPRCEG